jgi:hypothetical protein
VTLTLAYNDAHNNQHSDYVGCTPGEGSISLDPLFVDAANDDYHLQPQSPAIDAGDPDPAYNDEEDPANPGQAIYPAMGTVRSDMGAYGGKGGVWPPVPLDSVVILGPVGGATWATHHFTATIAPVYASLPITYTWDPAPLSGQGTAQVAYQWSSPGDRLITVMATNDAGGVTDTHTISLHPPPGYDVYLPIVVKNPAD